MRYAGFVMTNSPEDSGNSHNYFMNGVIKDDISETGCGEFFDYSTLKNLFAVVDSSKCEIENADISFLCTEMLTNYVGIDFNTEYKGVFNRLNDLVKGRLFCHKGKSICVSAGVLFLNNNVARAYNVGDTKVFYFKNNKLDKISGDVPKIIEAKESAFNTDGGVKIRTAKKEVAPYLGYMKANCFIEPYVSPAIKVAKGDIFLITSESVANSLNEDFISEILANNKFKINDKVEMLIDAATEKNPSENYTIQMICAQDGKRLFGIRLKYLISVIAAMVVIGAFSLFSGTISQSVINATRNIKTTIVNIMPNGNSKKAVADPWIPLEEKFQRDKSNKKAESSVDETYVAKSKSEETQTGEKPAVENNKKSQIKKNNQNSSTSYENPNAEISSQQQETTVLESTSNNDTNSTSYDETIKSDFSTPVLPAVEENVGSELPIDFN